MTSEKDITFDIKLPQGEITANSPATAPMEAEATMRSENNDTPNSKKNEQQQQQSRQRQQQSEENQPAEKAEKKLMLKLLSSTISDDDSVNWAAFKELITGGALVTVLRANWGFLLLSVFYIVVYIAVGYKIQDKIIESENLSQELMDWRYKALTQTSELQERTLRSRLEKILKDTTLQTSTENNYLLPVEKTE